MLSPLTGRPTCRAFVNRVEADAGGRRRWPSGRHWTRSSGSPSRTGRASRLLAAEIARCDSGTGGLTARKSWLAAFTFGLLHVFGFAGALSQIGLPTGDVPLALLAFNLGVEAGQIAFIAAATALLRATQALRIRPRPWMRAVPAYTIGSFASFWLLQRCAALFG